MIVYFLYRRIEKLELKLKRLEDNDSEDKNQLS